MARRRGGYQKPSNGGGASPPGALAQRKVPHLERTGLAYGENKAVNEQQSAAPLSAAGTPGAGVPPSPRRALPTGEEGIFGGTDRPHEPMTSGVDMGAGPGAQQPLMQEDPNMLLRALADAFPHPDLDRLLARIARG